MKKLFAAAIAAILLFSLTLTACGERTVPAPIEVSAYAEYDEAAFAAETARTKDVCLAENGSGFYTICVDPSTYDDIAADVEFLQSALRRMTGDDDAFAVTVGSDAPSEQTIFIGSGADVSAVKDDGYSLHIGSDGAIGINAANSDGLANGIYCFLENELGCMFVRDDYSYIPYLPTIWLDAQDKTDNPDFAWRRIYQYEVSNGGDWSRRIKSNGTGESLDIGNDGNRYWGKWCHSVFSYVDPEIYFDEYPEYFAEIDGVRYHTYTDGRPTQLCLTNPDIYQIIEKNMEHMMGEYPEAVYWDFSINDSWLACQCEDCTAAYEKYGSHMGAMLEIVNQLARRFPDKHISTLAYFYNNVVPECIECEPNVNIVVAPIQTSQLYSAKDGANDRSAEAKRMIEEWSAICDNIFVWDYVVNFSHLLLPYPNYSVQRDNLEFYKEHNVRSVFHQGSREQGDEQACLRSYVLARQLWDIDSDVEAIIGKYLAVTYGDAAPYIAEYIDVMHASVAENASDLDLYDDPAWHYGDYLSPSLLSRYDDLTLDALAAVADDPQKTAFVEELRLNVLYARMTAGGFDVIDKEAAFEEFAPLARKLGISRPYEIAPPDMEEFIQTVYPEYLKTQKLYLSLIVIAAAAVLAGGVTAAVLIPKRLRKKRAPRPAEKE